MFFYDYNFDTMYHITRKSAEEGLRKILTSRVNARFNAKMSNTIIESIMNNISIPNEYANDKCIYMSVDNAFSEFMGIRFAITATEVIKCKNPDTGSDLISIPLPTCKKKADYYDLLPLNSLNIFSDLAVYEQKGGFIKQSGGLSDMIFSVSPSFKSLIAEQLEDVFTRSYAMRIANAIDKSISSTTHRFFVYRLNNKKPVYYECNHKAASVLDNAADKSTISADLILKVIKLYTKEITCIDEELTKIANRIHNILWYNIKYSKEELKEPYDIVKVRDHKMRFCFKKKADDIEFLFKTEPYNWISDFIGAPLKDIEWTKAASDSNYYYAPSYKGHRIVIPNTDMWLTDWPEMECNKIYIDGWTKKIVSDDQIDLKGAELKYQKSIGEINEDTLVYFMVVMD